MNNKLVIFGGQYGSEGKASAAEFWAKQFKNQSIVVLGENGPNSGHTSSKGSTKNIPASSFWADYIILGPDSVINKDILIQDWETVGKKPLFIHEHAALMPKNAGTKEIEVIKRISSTGSGTGTARKNKFFDRQNKAIIKGATFPKGISIVSNEEYKNILKQCYYRTMIFECSQGALLDTNFGIFPYVTSRPTLPRVAIERNGLGWFDWTYVGVYRTYPIRTGGPSGPTGGPELNWNSLGVKPEQATVTKRIRRIFEFSEEDFCKSFYLTQPDILMFTFLDYIGINPKDSLDFQEWLEYYNIQDIRRLPVYVSNCTGKFYQWPVSSFSRATS